MSTPKGKSAKENGQDRIPASNVDVRPQSQNTSRESAIAQLARAMQANGEQATPMQQSPIPDEPNWEDPQSLVCDNCGVRGDGQYKRDQFTGRAVHYGYCPGNVQRLPPSVPVNAIAPDAGVLAGGERIMIPTIPLKQTADRLTPEQSE